VPDRNAFDNIRFVGPKPNMMSGLASENNGQSGASRACSDDGNAAHLWLARIVSDLVAPNRDSVPEARRPIFCRCFQITRAETAAI